MTFFSLKRFSYVLGGWLLFSLILFAKTTAEGRPQIWALQDASEYAIWALIALILYPLVSSTPFKMKAWVKRLPVLLVIWHVGGALAHTADQAVHQGMVHDASRQHSVVAVIQHEVPRQLLRFQFRHLADFLGLLAFCSILVLIRNSRERELEHSKLRTQLADARLNTLRAQMHPHFLFNTLNTVATLATTNSKEAVEVLSQLSELLRRASAVDESHLTTVKEEFNLTRSYVNIMQHRFGDRVSVNMSCDPQIESALVPVLTLQPLVENAYQHGVGPRSTGGTINIEGVLSNGCVELIVSDDGLGENAGANEKGQGMALENVRDRLLHLFDGKGTLTTEFIEEGGFRAVVSVPYLRSEDL